jgi:hexosaminidase
MKHLAALLICLLSQCILQAQKGIIPQPQEIEFNGQDFLAYNCFIAYDDSSLFPEAEFLQSSIKRFFQKDIETVLRPNYAAEKDPPFYIVLNTIQPDTLLPLGWYSLHVDKNRISVTATEKEGIFYGIQSLLQLGYTDNKKNLAFHGTSIPNDFPNMKWRGMHLDVSRHFFPKEFILKYIDLLAMNKMNVFHWHLTDDQGWRIEIKKYPKLTSVGGWRKGSMLGHYNEQRYDTIRYGGFYTQDDIREVVAYAEKRHVTIVPEIEMPGHALAALSAYPQFSCTGGPFDVARGWGVFDDVFCPKEETFTFLQDILDEVVTLFPGKYIHIGGDECPKTRWEKCKACQKRIKDNNLKDEMALQSYFIQRIEKYLNSKGKQIIGWDEILEGGLAPNAAVMSWRGTEGGIEAAHLHHPVVMTPGSHCYFDHYQGNPRQEPIAIGGFTSLEKVYSFHPIPEKLTPEERTYILGAQGNVWTEYINTSRDVEYMAVPRMSALAEVLWTNEVSRNYIHFTERLTEFSGLLKKMDVNMAHSWQRPVLSTVAQNGVLKAEAKPPVPGKKMMYELTKPGMKINGAKMEYVAPVDLIDKNIQFRVWVDENDSTRYESSLNIRSSLASAKQVSFAKAPSEHYPGKGGFTLVDGIIAVLPRINSEWLGWSGDDMIATIDLGASQTISTAEIGVLHDPTNWIYEPSEIQLEKSIDGTNWEPILSTIVAPVKPNMRKKQMKFSPVNARYIRINAKNPGLIPAGNPGAGKNSWIFFDEIIIE